MVPLRFGTNNLYFVTRIKKIEFLSPKKKKKKFNWDKSAKILTVELNEHAWYSKSKN